MKIYLLNAPFKENFVRCGRWQGVAARGGTLYYPIWLSYATGLLEKEGHEIKLVDAVAWKWDIQKVVDDAKLFSPNLIVIDSNFSSLKNDIEIGNLLKEKIDTFTIIVGPPASQYSEYILKCGIDFVARYEYEFTLLDLVNQGLNSENYSHIKGLSFKNNGVIQHNPNREFSTEKDLDEIPFVSKIYKEHLNVKDYFLNHAYYPMIQIITSRGCPNQCTFCSWPETLTGRKYRMRSIENIVAEFEFIQKEIPEVKEIFIEDDCFTVNKNNVLEFCSQLESKKIRINWGCQSRANLDYETMIAMKKAGCKLLDVGYESGSELILKNIKKGINVEQLRKFTVNAKKAKLKILADFVIGFNGETQETINETQKFIEEIKPDLLQVAVATPIPGTVFYEHCMKNNLLLASDMEESLNEKGIQKCIISYLNLSNNDIEAAVKKIINEYYLNINYIPIAFKGLLNKNFYDEFILLKKSCNAFFRKST